MVTRAPCTLLLILAACVHQSPESRILAAFGEGMVRSERTDHPADTTVKNCGEVTTLVTNIMRENAVVAVFQDCTIARSPCPSGQNCLGGNAVRFESDYLMVRTNGRWKVCRAISGGVFPIG